MPEKVGGEVVDHRLLGTLCVPYSIRLPPAKTSAVWGAGTNGVGKRGVVDSNALLCPCSQLMALRKLLLHGHL
jgi:hypothetical protein